MPSKRWISGPRAAWYSCSTPITSSGPARSAKAVKPRRSQNTTDDLAAVALQQALAAGRDDQVGHLGRQEAPQPADPLDLRHLLRHPPLQRAVPGRELGRLELEPAGLLLHRVVQRLDPQDRAHAGDERRLLDRLGQVLVRPGVEPGHDVRDGGLGGDQDDRHERQRRVGPEPPADLEPVELRHHHVEQDQVGQEPARRRERLLAVGGAGGGVALARQPGLQDLAVVRVVVDDQDQGRVAHRVTRRPAGSPAPSPGAAAG